MFASVRIVLVLTASVKQEVVVVGRLRSINLLKKNKKRLLMVKNYKETNK